MSKLKIWANNGNCLARDMHELSLLNNGMTIEDYYNIAILYTANNIQRNWLLNDDYWEDFCSTIEELGYKLKY